MKPDDSRFTQIQILISEARALVIAIEAEGGHKPVTQARLRRIKDHLLYALAGSEWFTRRYPDEASKTNQKENQ